MRFTDHTRPAIVVLALSVLGAACGGSTEAGGGASAGLSGTIAISGSSTVQPITQLVAERFAGANPDVQISVDGPGTGDGFVLFCEGTTDVSDASRPMKEEEAAACADAGVDYVELEIGLDGITVLTNPANDVASCLTTGDLYALFGPESRGFGSWSDANALAEAVGGTGGFPDEPLGIVAPGEESGTYDAFIDLAGIEDVAMARGVSEDLTGSLRPDYQSSANDTVIIQGIEGSPTELGFVGFAYADLQGDGVKKLEIDAGQGCVPPSAASISDGTYPLSRSLYVYVNTAKAAESETLAAFVDHLLSEGGMAAVTDADYVALPEERIEAARAAWEGATAG